MLEEKSNQQKALNQIINYANSQIIAGVKVEQLKKDLIGKGVPENAAAQIVQTANNHVKKMAKKFGMNMFIQGLVIAIIGAIVTAGSFFAGMEEGGPFVIAYGAIAVGGIYAIIGIVCWSTGWNPKVLFKKF